MGSLVEIHQQVAGLLGDPGSGRVGGDANDVDLPSGQFQEEQHVDALEDHGVEGAEVAGEDGVGLGGEELLPGCSGPAGCGVDAGLVEDLPHGAGRHPVAQADEFTVDTAMASARVLRGEA